VAREFPQPMTSEFKEQVEALFEQAEALAPEARSPALLDLRHRILAGARSATIGHGNIWAGQPKLRTAPCETFAAESGSRIC